MIRRILAVGAVLALAGCAHNENKSKSATYSSSTQPTAAQTAATPTCPVWVPNTTVQCRDVANGVAMDFVTSGNTSELRTRVHNLAGYEEQATASSGAIGSNQPGYESNSQTGTSGYGESGQARTSESMGQTEQPQVGGSDGTNGGISAGASGSMGQPAGAGATGAAGFFGVPVKTQVQDISGGSQLILTPVNPGQIDTLRQNAQQMAMMMQSGKCPVPGSAGSSPTPGSGGENPGETPGGGANPSGGSDSGGGSNY